MGPGGLAETWAAPLIYSKRKKKKEDKTQTRFSFCYSLKLKTSSSLVLNVGLKGSDAARIYGNASFFGRDRDRK